MLKIQNLAAVALSVCLVALPAMAYDPMAQDDMAIGLSAGSTTYRVVRNVKNQTPVVSVTNGTPPADFGPGWAPRYMQSMEFDNAGYLSHNPSGHLLAANFGNAFTGFEIHTLATDGTGNSTSLWGIKSLSGDARTDRGGGVSVSPCNDKIAWTDYDSGGIWVLRYDAGPNPGSGAGAQITGAIETVGGDGAGNPGAFTPLNTQDTQGSTWLNNNCLVAFNTFGELVTLCVEPSEPACGPGNCGDCAQWPDQPAPWPPATTSKWQIVCSDLPLNANQTDIEYNPEIDPFHIYGIQNTYDGVTSTNTLYAWDYDPVRCVISCDPYQCDLSSPEVDSIREMAFDSEGNLYISHYSTGDPGEYLVTQLPAAVALDPQNWSACDVVAFFEDQQFAGYNGMDVAKGLPIKNHII